MRFIKRHFGLIFVSILAAVGAFYVAAPKPPAKAALVAVQQSPVVRVLALNGRVRPYESSTIAAKRAGILLDASVDDGALVKAGQILGHIDSEAEQASVSAAQKALSARKLQLAQAQRDLSRMQKLRADGYATQAQIEQSRLSVSTGVQEVAQLTATVEQAKAGLDDGTIVAPFDGTILRRLVDPGTNVTTSTSIFTIARDGEQDIEAESDEIYAGALSVDQPVTVLVPALNGQTFTGKIYWLAPNIDTASGGRLLRVHADGLAALQPGTTVSLTVRVGESKNALTVPRDAVLTPQTDASVLRFNAAQNRLEKTAIKVVDWPAERVEVTQGLAKGDRIAAAPKGFTDGQVITPTDVAKKETIH